MPDPAENAHLVNACLSESSHMVTKVSILGKDTIHLGYNIQDHIVCDILENIKSSTYVLITDTNIAQHDHLQKIEREFEKAAASMSPAPRFLKYLIPPGEFSKSRATKAEVEDFMLQNQCTRDTVILALGGGVIGDMIGYVAATFMRGVRFVQIPTSLLAMVDSSIGGKTAIDTPNGKNLVGAFWQPERVFIDITFLETLPEREFINGMAEIVKTAAIWNEEEFARLERLAPAFFECLASRVNYRINIEPVQDVFLSIVKGSVKVKAEVVTADEREGGLRNILNFGHSIGHAYEAILTPHILHGECVSIGMVLEAELSRYLGHMSAASVARLTSCLKTYKLPVSSLDPVVLERSSFIPSPVDRLLEIMNVDKKNDGNKKKVVLLESIGKCWEPKASVVTDDQLRVILTDDISVGSTAAVPKEYTIIPPGSKSISNRVMLLAALGEGTCRIENLLHSDDTGYMLEALRNLNAATITTDNGGDVIVVEGHGGKLSAPKAPVYLGNAGTATRFLSCLANFVQASDESETVVITGNSRMQQRPIGPLIDALIGVGAKIEYLNAQDCPPIRAQALKHGAKFPGGRYELSATISSQYVSAILMCAPYAEEPVTLSLVGGKPISQLYIDMTIQMMADFGIKVEKSTTEEYTYHIPTGVYKNPKRYVVESDASSATYPLAFAAITGTKCIVPSMGSRSLQGDARFAVDVLKPMGCTVEQTESQTIVQGPKQGGLVALENIDMEPMTDAFLTASVVAAVAKGTTRIYGIANQRVKESNRIKVMCTELAKFGVTCREHDDGLEIDGIPVGSLLTPASIHTYDDHRVAMSFSLIATQAPAPVRIEERRCTSKTWPGWWDTLAALGVKLEGVENTALLATHPTPEPVSTSIVLIGMRGAGKTSISRKIAGILGWASTDLDDHLESVNQKSIPEMIETDGWDRFRELETQLFTKFLSTHSHRHVIATGGGLVESPAARTALKEYIAKGGLVIHVHRNMDTIVEFLGRDKTRPAYTDHITTVWERRKIWYQECSNRFFFSIHIGSHDDEKLYRDALSRHVRSLVNPTKVDVPSLRSYFLSLTYPDLGAVSGLSTVTQGCSAVELRVDLLKSTAQEYVAEQLGLLRFHTTLPIIYTVRTHAQGGQFDDQNTDNYVELVKLGFKLCVEYVDIELTQPQRYWDEFHKIKSNSRIIASHHDIKGELNWTDKEWRVKYFHASRLGDIVKFVGTASRFEDNLQLEAFRSAHTGPGLKPLIAINMGTAGKMSRALNTILTPVTHEEVPFPAAPGQLSIRDIHHALSLWGALEAKKFFVCGNPISHSQSPNLHNESFQELALPHQYTRFETDNVHNVISYIKELGDDFRGASVTIPFKRDIMPFMDSLSGDAQLIGAVNTISLSEDGKLIGSNTDWLGIKNSFEKWGVNNVGHVHSALILGAGGTALAGVYAFHEMGFKRIYILNRSRENAQKVIDNFPPEYNVQIYDETVPTSVYCILSCVPAQIPIDQQVFGKLKLVLAQANTCAMQRTLLDAAYKPSVTPVMEAAQGYGWSTIPGREMLVFQGVEQFHQWTGLRALAAAQRAVL